MTKIKLTKKGIKMTDPEFLNIANEIQGNILKSHGRGHTSQIFFRFNPNNITKAKAFIQNFARNQVTSAAIQKEHAELFKTPKKPQKTFFGFYLSSLGYDYLQISPDKKPQDNEFLQGMKASNDALEDADVSTWDSGYKTDIHGMILIARGDTRKKLDTEVHKVIEKLRKETLATILCVEEGDGIQNTNGDDIEHFGYVDGISQPHFFHEEMEGKTTVDWNSIMPLDLVLVPDIASKNENAFGSYFVYRKLEQNVMGFKIRERQLAEELFGDPDSELAGAMVMGRFENGMPVTMSPTDEDLTIATDLTVGKINDFNYNMDTAGAKCPFHSHIRKTNPRGESPFEEPVEEKHHMMARRGIIYGKRFIHPNEAEIEELPTKDVGLLFMSFQANLANQFEFIQQTWSNNENFIKQKTGKDPVIGQGNFKNGMQKYAKEYGEKSSITAASGFGNFVTLKGGEYFYAPSMDFLKNILAV